MRRLQSRVERLEAATPKPPDIQIIVLSCKAPPGEQLGELRGFSSGDLYIARQPGESETALLARAEEAVRRPGRVALLIEDRAPVGG